MGFNQMGMKVLQNLFKKPATVRYPFEKKAPVKNSRGKITVDPNLCIYCQICQRRCPADAIQVSKDPKEWQIEPGRCVSCGICVEVCPKKCLFISNQFSDVYTVWPVEKFTPNA